jgi:dienelactone hydrolase
MAADPVLAKPSGPCCLNGTIHKGEAKGKFVTLSGVETYVGTPKNPNGHILLYFPDVWGMFPNGLLIMDGFADAGYLVLGMDYFRGVNSHSRTLITEQNGTHLIL